MSFCNPSRFLKDIDPELLDLPEDYKILYGRLSGKENFSPFSSSGVKQETAPANPHSISSRIPQNYNNIQTGSFVEHEKFGIGKVMVLEGFGSNLKATISFKNSGERCILLKYAKMKIID
jgi:DNA helicase-2/ATP-dependent DNA helicase PcrA